MQKNFVYFSEFILYQGQRSLLLSMNIWHIFFLPSYTMLVRKPTGRPHHLPSLSAQPPTIVHPCPEKGGPFSQKRCRHRSTPPYICQIQAGRPLSSPTNLSRTPDKILGSMAAMFRKSAAKGKGNCLRNCLLVNQEFCAIVRHHIKYLLQFSAAFCPVLIISYTFLQGSREAESGPGILLPNEIHCFRKGKPFNPQCLYFSFFSEKTQS